MATPQLGVEQIAQLSALVARYITNQREKYSPRAVRLSAQQATAMARFFSPQLLDQARLLVLKGERVANPEFYPMLQDMGFNNLPDQSTMGAITFSDVVVSHGAFSAGNSAFAVLPNSTFEVFWLAAGMTRYRWR